MKSLLLEFHKCPEMRTLVKEQEISPSDKMALDPVLAVTDPELTSFLANHESPVLQASSEYLRQIRIYWEAFNSNKGPPEQRLVKMEDALKYFQTMDVLGSEFVTHMKVSVESMKTLYSRSKERGDPFQTFSSFSTLVVENYFSRVYVMLCSVLLFTYQFR